MEAVVGEPFEKYMQRFFKELGLSNTYLDENEPIIYNRARSDNWRGWGVRIESSLIFTNVAPEGAKADFYVKRDVFKIEQKVAQYLG